MLLAPRPELALSYRLPIAPDLPLRVRAVPSLTLALGIDDATFPANPFLERDRERRAVVAAVLFTPKGRAFSAPAVAGRLPPAVFVELERAVWEALDTICPTFGRSMIDDVHGVLGWHSVLMQGAGHGSNAARTHVLSTFVETSASMTTVYRRPRPDLYWQTPGVDMLDGHLMCFTAACAVMKVK